MEVSSYLTFEGEQLVSWIKEDEETGLINIIFDTMGNENGLSFEPDCFDAFAKAINEFQEKGKTSHDHERCKGRIRPNLIELAIDNDKRVTIQPDLGTFEGEKPFMLITSGKSRFCFHFNESQAKVLIDVLKKIVEAKQSVKEAEKEKVVQS